MSDSKTAQEKIASMGANVSSHVNDAIKEARPVMERVSHRIKDELNHMGDVGMDAAADVKHKIENEAHHVRVTAAHFVQHQPLNAILIAAGTGALAAMAASWLLRSRQP